MSQLHFFRHAQASYLAENYDQLSPKGEIQSAALGKYLVEKNFHFDKIYTGPLKRQKHTYEIVKSVFAKNKKQIPLAIELPELKEHSGPKGLRIMLPDLIQSDPKIQALQQAIEKEPSLKRKYSILIFQHFMEQWVEGNFKIAEVEPWSVFRKEVQNGLKHILEQTEKGEKVGIFTSGGTIAAITAEALKVDTEKRVAAMNFSVRNTSFSSFLYSRSQFNLLSFNEIPHLPEDLITFV